MVKYNETHIFDDVFRTMEEHTPELMLPLINEVFKTNYPENTKVVRLGDKRHLLQHSMETDSCLSIADKLYHFECESNPDNGTIAIRMFQYDVTVALEKKRKENGTYVVEFPLSCVIYLRHGKHTRDRENVLVRMPDGRSIEYTVPVLKSQKFSKSEEYEELCSDLVEALGKKNPLAYSELHKLMSRVQEYVLVKRGETKKGVQQIMGGHVLESWKEEMIRIGREEGREEGRTVTLASLVNQGIITLEKAAEEAGMTVEEFETLCREKNL